MFYYRHHGHIHCSNDVDDNDDNKNIVWNLTKILYDCQFSLLAATHFLVTQLGECDVRSGQQLLRDVFSVFITCLLDNVRIITGRSFMLTL